MDDPSPTRPNGGGGRKRVGYGARTKEERNEARRAERRKQQHEKEKKKRQQQHQQSTKNLASAASAPAAAAATKPSKLKMAKKKKNGRNRSDTASADEDKMRATTDAIADSLLSGSGFSGGDEGEFTMSSLERLGREDSISREKPDPFSKSDDDSDQRLLDDSDDEEEEETKDEPRQKKQAAEFNDDTDTDEDDAGYLGRAQIRPKTQQQQRRKRRKRIKDDSSESEDDDGDSAAAMDVDDEDKSAGGRSERKKRPHSQPGGGILATMSSLRGGRDGEGPTSRHHRRQRTNDEPAGDILQQTGDGQGDNGRRVKRWDDDQHNYQHQHPLSQQSSLIESNEIITDPADPNDSQSLMPLSQDDGTRGSVVVARDKTRRRKSSPYSDMYRSSDLESLDRSSASVRGGSTRRGDSKRKAKNQGGEEDGDSDDNYQSVDSSDDNYDDDEENEYGDEEAFDTLASASRTANRGSSDLRRSQRHCQQQRHHDDVNETDNDEENEFTFNNDGRDSEEESDEDRFRIHPRLVESRSSTAKSKGRKLHQEPAASGNETSLRTTPNSSKEGSITPKIDNRTSISQQRKRKKRKKTLPALPKEGDADVFAGFESMTFNQSQESLKKKEERKERSSVRNTKTIIRGRRGVSTIGRMPHRVSRGAEGIDGLTEKDEPNHTVQADPFLEDDPSAEVEDEIEEFQDTQQTRDSIVDDSSIDDAGGPSSKDRGGRRQRVSGDGTSHMELADNYDECDEHNKLTTQPEPQDGQESFSTELTGSSSDGGKDDDVSSYVASQQEDLRHGAKKRQKSLRERLDDEPGVLGTMERPTQVAVANATKTNSTEKMSEEGEEILHSIDHLERLSKKHRAEMVGTTECLQEQAKELKRLRDFLVMESPGRGKYESAMRALENDHRVLKILTSSFAIALKGVVCAGNIRAGERKQRISCLLSCLKFLVRIRSFDALDLVSLFNLYSSNDPSPVYTKDVQQVLTNPSVISGLLPLLLGAPRTSKKMGKEEMTNRAQVALYSIACLSAADLRCFTENVLSVACKASSAGVSNELESIRDIAASLGDIESYPKLELVLLFIMRFRRSLMMALVGKGKTKSKIAQETLDGLDTVLPDIYRKRLSDLDMQLSSDTTSTRASSSLYQEEEETQLFCSWARECTKYGAGKVITFACNGVFNPKNAEEIRSRIGAVDTIHVNESTLSFFVDCGAGDDATRRTFESSCTSTDSSSSKQRPFSVEDYITNKTKLVETRFTGWRDDDGNIPQSPIVYASSREVGAINIHLSTEEMSESNLEAILQSEGNLTSDSQDECDDAICFRDDDDKGHSNVLRLHMKKDEFHSFCKALENRGVLIKTEEEAEDCSARGSLDAAASRGEDEESIIDGTEFSTRRIRELPRCNEEKVQSQSHSTQQSDGNHDLEAMEQGGEKYVENENGVDAAQDGNGNSFQNSKIGATRSNGKGSSHSSKDERIAKRKRDEIDGSGEEEEERDPETRSPESGKSKQAKIGEKRAEHNGQKQTRKVTPPPPTNGVAHKQTSTSTSPLRSEIAHHDHDGLSQRLDTKFSKAESNLSHLESISAQCCALSAAKLGAAYHGNESGLLKADTTLPMGQIAGSDGDNLAQDVLAYDAALAQAVDALSTVSRLAKKIQATCSDAAGLSTNATTEKRDGGVVVDDEPSQTAFGWIDGPLELVRSQQQKWAAERRDVEKQLQNILIQQLTSIK